MTLWSTYLNSHLRFIDAAGIRTRVVTTPGPTDRRPVLLLHGRGGHLESFHRNVAALSTHSEVVAFDLLGHGLTAHAGTTYDIGEITRHANHVIDLLDDGRGFDVVAQSLGAWTAMLSSLERPGRFGRMVLIEPAGLQRQSERLDDPRVRQASSAGGQAFDNPTAENVRLRFAQLLHDPGSCDDEMVELRCRLYRLPGAGAVHKAVRTADNDTDVITSHALRDIAAPVLFVRGEHAHLPTDLLRDAADHISGAELFTVEAAKQWPHYEQPDQVNARVIHHFER
ncbi:alpha/beta fold hydrolase [Nocardia noduli]|uniref:alpha/beta fold hydrolase n=1 Tax=Nocardia noduli TaxID=2815722 RepID=UPI001C217DD1|nr:alpha/beta hydrolase [Nocardia noduli]